MQKLTFPLVSNAKLVSEEHRPDFLPKLFNNDLKAIAVMERALYHTAETLSPDEYDGGFWEYVHISNNVGFAYPSVTDGEIYFVDTVYGVVELDAVSFGLVCTIIATNKLIWGYHAKGDLGRAKRFDKLYHQLRDWLHCDNTTEQVGEQVGAENRDKLYSAIWRVLD